MKRTKISKKPDAILCSDIHLREDTPTCRTDDYQTAQWKKLAFIRHLQLEYNCIVLHGGDLFHHWKPSPQLLSMAILNLPAKFHTIYGQHDLPQHKFDLRHKSGIHTLATDSTLTVLEECHYGQKPIKGSIVTRMTAKGEKIDTIPIQKIMSQYIEMGGRNILVWHKMVWQGKKLWPDQVDPSAKRILKQYPDYDLIVTGDNHKPFVEEYTVYLKSDPTKYVRRLLVNPGSMMRMTADQIDHKPRVYLWYADTNTVQPVYLPIESGVITREHITRTEERNDRIDAFISKLDTEWEASVSFEENLERFAKSNNVRQSVMDIIIKAIGL